MTLSLSPHLLPLCRTCGITETRTALTWLEPNTASDVKRPNISRALIWRQWKNVTCSAVCVPAHTTCDNQSFPILPEYASVTIRWYTMRPTVGAWREGNKDHDIDATKTSGSLPWSSRCHCLPLLLFPHSLNIIARVLVRTHKRKIETSTNGRTQRMHPPVAKARESWSNQTQKNHWRPVKISAWSKSATFAKDSRCAAELWTTTSQSEVGGTQAGDTHSVLSCTRKGSSPEMAGSGELLLPLSMAPHVPPNGTPIRRGQQIIGKRSCMFACPGTSPWQTTRQK